MSVAPKSSPRSGSAALGDASDKWRARRDRAFGVTVGGAALAVAVVLAVLVGATALRGALGMAEVLASAAALVVEPLASMRAASLLWRALGATLQYVAMALLPAVVLGVGAALHATEAPRAPLARATGVVIRALDELPGVVLAGGLSLAFVLPLGPAASAPALVVALTLLMLPSVVERVAAALRRVPRRVRDAARALGAPRWRTALLILLPIVGRDIAAGAAVATARAVGAASPALILLSSDPRAQAPLSSVVYAASGSGHESSVGWAAAFMLFAAVAALRASAARATDGADEEG